MNRLLFHSWMDNDNNTFSNKISDFSDKNHKISPWYITGLTDGEGSFQITIQDIKGKGLTGFKPFL